MEQTTKNSRLIKASAGTIYNAFMNPRAIEMWLAPAGMNGKVHRFDVREGGGYEMSLFYPDSDREQNGKTSAGEDRYTARFIELRPFEKIVVAINFDSTDPKFSGEMIMEVTFKKSGEGTNVTFLFMNIPVGISPEDNKKGTLSTLEKLASFTEEQEREIDEQYSDGSANAFEDK